MEEKSIRDLQVVDVTAVTNPFGFANKTYKMQLGQSVQDIINNTCPDLIKYKPRVFLNDHLIDEKFYHRIYPKAGSLISIRILPQGGGGGGGGKNPLRTVLSIAVVVAAVATGQVYGVAAASTLFSGGVVTATQLAIGTALVTAGVSIVGNLLVNAIAPISQPRAGSRGSGIERDVSQTYFIQGARNQLTPFEPIPSVLGKHRIVPPLATQNYTENSGDLIFVRQMFALGWGKHIITNEQIGETELSSFKNVTQENFFDGNSTDNSSIIPRITTDNLLNVSLESGGAFQRITTSPDVNEFEVQLSLGGLVRYSNEGKKLPITLRYTIRYRLKDVGSYTSQTFTETRSTNAAFSLSKRFSVPEGQYDVEVQKIDIVNNVSDLETLDESSGQILSDVTWTNLRSIKNANPVNIDGLSLKAVRIQGTEQLNGAIDQYNCIASRKIPDWNGATWVEDQETSNPASIFRYILLADEARRKISEDEIDMTAIQQWHDFCEEKNFTYNAYIDFSTDRENLLREISAAGLASPTIIDNKYSVVVDKEKTDIIQHISQRNSYDYSYEKVFNELPHAFRVAFINKDKNYLQDEIIVYDDGYNSANATKFSQIDFPGVVDSQAIYKLARHRLAELRLRPDIHSVTMDIENLVATKGDKVKFSHDVSLIGVASGRVISREEESGFISSVAIDEDVGFIPGVSYSAEFRTSTGSNLSISIVNPETVSNVLTFSTSVLISSAPDIGDLTIVGETESVSLECLILAIEPQPDFAASIKLVEYAPGIFTAAEGTIPSYNNNVTLPPEFRRPQQPVLIKIQSDEFVQVRNIDGSISSRAVITLRNNNLFVVEPVVKIKQTGSSDYDIAETVTRTPTKIVLEGLDEGSLYDFQIFYRRTESLTFPVGVLSESLEINGYQFIGESNNPPDVENFDITVRSDSVFLSWDKVDVLDLNGYELRFQPVVTGASWGSSLPMNVPITKDQASVTVPSDIGTYMIKAFDRSGNLSENATLAVTTVGRLEQLNIVETITESTSWAGTNDGTAIADGNLQLSSIDIVDDWTLVDDIVSWDLGESGLGSEGVYNFASAVDLTEVYTSVISANLTISASNELDLIDSWGFVDERSTWENVNPDKYNVVLEIRTTNDDPASGSAVWSTWMPLKTLSEYTARGIELRLLLSSLDLGVTPVITSCVVSVDMPDRIESADDITITAGGDTVSYSASFNTTPVGPEITIDDLQTGDYHVISNRTSGGFDIEFFNSSATSVERTFSYIVKGYGRVS